MVDLFSYELADFLMFSPATYYRMMDSYSEGLSVLLGVPSGLIFIALIWGLKAGKYGPLYVVVGACWLMIAWLFFLGTLQEIMWASVYIAVIFLTQGIVMIWMALRQAFKANRLRTENDLAGLLPIVIALLYPLFGYFGLGSIEYAGLMPDPTVLLTMAILALRRQPAWLYVIPAVWVLFSGVLLYTMEQPHYWLLPALATVTAGREFVSWRQNARKV